MSSRQAYVVATAITCIVGTSAIAILARRKHKRRQQQQGRSAHEKTMSSAADSAAAAVSFRIRTTLVSQWTVLPNPPLALPPPVETIGMDGKSESLSESRECLSEVDEWLTRGNKWLRFTLRFDDVLDVDSVKLGLARTVSHIPALAARVDVKRNPLQYELVLNCSDVSADGGDCDDGKNKKRNRGGVIFEVADGSIVIVSSVDGSHAEVETTTETSLQKRHDLLPDDTSPRDAWIKAGLDAPVSGYDGAPGPHDPLFRARLTIFKAEGVSYLAVGISHGLCDGHGVADILQIWSHFCTPSSTTEGLPQTLRRPRCFGRRVSEPIRPAKDVDELTRRRKSGDVPGCEDVNPLSGWAFVRYLLPRAIWCMATHRVLEIRVNAERLNLLKGEILKALPEGEWASRFEVLFAALLTAKRATAVGNKPSFPSEHYLNVACNLRGRAKRFSEDYFGNGSFDFRRQMNLPEHTTWDMSDLVRITQEVHRAVREGLDDPEDLCKTKDWFEAARHLGIRNTYDFWPVVLDAVRGTGTLVNSWDNRWMKVSMGSTAQKNATAMVAYFRVVQNLYVEVPRHSQTGDSTVQLALPVKHAERFVAFCERQKNEHSNESPIMPFSVVA